jgi:DNA alkylation damage repair protein AlkB
LIPSLFPPTVQTKLLSRIFHRDLSDPRHQTNVHLHYNVTYPDRSKVLHDQEAADESPHGSFFQADPTLVLSPKDPETHKPITIQNFLEKKLRWMTLGGQYNWTTKEYPAEPPPPFPRDIARLLRAAFPETDAQAAIVNLYSTGDTLSMHRDVSEECDSGLISVSFGCDGLFVVSHDDGQGCEVIRLRSGDAVYMAGRSRFAWHGVPKVLSSTCPAWLQDWPGPDYEYWQGWMGGKRVNLNVRQMSAVDQPLPMEH